MTGRQVRNVAASVRQRLFRMAQVRGERFERLLQRYAIERFLFRLGVSAHHDRFILKGATLLALLGENRYRPTRDLDLLGVGDSSEPTIRRIIAEICTVAVESADGINYRSETIRTEPIRESEEYEGLRVRLRCALGDADIPLQIDIGFGDRVFPAPQEAEYPSLLDLPRPRIRVYPLETVVAEKLEAIVRFGETNGRIKDFHDIWLIAGTTAFTGASLVRAVRGTFERRGTPLPVGMPSGLAAEFFRNADVARLWRAFLADRLLEANPPLLADVGDRLRMFLLPVMAAARDAEAGSNPGDWSPQQGWHRIS